MTGKHAMGWTPGRVMGGRNSEAMHKRKASAFGGAGSLGELIGSKSKHRMHAKYRPPSASVGGANIVRWKGVRGAVARITAMNRRGALNKLEFFIAKEILRTIAVNPSAKFADFSHDIYRKVQNSGLMYGSFVKKSSGTVHQVKRSPGLNSVRAVMDKLTRAEILSVSRGKEALKTKK
jgi:hypothetical protein